MVAAVLLTSLLISSVAPLFASSVAPASLVMTFAPVVSTSSWAKPVRGGDVAVIVQRQIDPADTGGGVADGAGAADVAAVDQRGGARKLRRGC